VTNNHNIIIRILKLSFYNNFVDVRVYSLPNSPVYRVYRTTITKRIKEKKYVIGYSLIIWYSCAMEGKDSGLIYIIIGHKSVYISERVTLDIN
jgi:hypothetical protein